MLILYRDLGTRNFSAKAVPQSLTCGLILSPQSSVSWRVAGWLTQSSRHIHPTSEYLSLTPEVKIDLQGRRFKDAQEMKKKATKQLNFFFFATLRRMYNACCSNGDILKINFFLLRVYLFLQHYNRKFTF